MRQWVLVVMVGVAGALGALARYGATVGLGRLFPGTTFPVGTLVVNISGAFLLGLVAGLARSRFAVGEAWMVVVGTGFLGAYTTFSTYMLESDKMVQNGEWLRGACYLAGSVFLGLVAVRLGMIVAGGEA